MGRETSNIGLNYDTPYSLKERSELVGFISLMEIYLMILLN
jgi:hypothetical protein